MWRRSWTRSPSSTPHAPVLPLGSRLLPSSLGEVIKTGLLRLADQESVEVTLTSKEKIA